MEKLFVLINKNKNEVYILTFSSGDIVEAVVDTCYETDNGLADTDRNFEEYHACVMRILKVLIDKSKTYKKGKLIEINYRNFPKEIRCHYGGEIINHD